MPLSDALIDHLDRWFDEGERAALDAACALAAAEAPPLPELLAHIEHARAPVESRRLAASALRWALGLPVVPGAPCRKGP